jgi:hypothetical protein
MTNREPADPQAILQFMTTEHSALANARSGTIFESSGRTTLYLTTVSSALVALAFIGQMSEMGQAFVVFTLVLLPTLLFIGWVTFVRVLQTAIEDMIYSRGINRIRHYYLEIAPQMRDYLILSDHDDTASMLKEMGQARSGWQMFMTTAGMVGTVNSVIGGVVVGVIALSLLQTTPPVSVIAGLVAFVVLLGLHMLYQARRWREVDQSIPVMFPGDAYEKGEAPGVSARG